MLATWLTRIVASFLVLALTTTTILVVMSQTVLSAAYLEHKLDATNGYSRLSTVLSGQVAQDAGLATPAVTAQVNTFLTPAVVKTRLNAALEQLQAYYQGKGPVPTLDFTDIATQAQAAGLPLGSDSRFAEPIKLGNVNDTSAQGNDHVQQSKAFGILVSTILAVLLAILCWKRREYRPLANVLIGTGITLGIIALFCGLSPSLFDHLVKFNSATSAVNSFVHDLVAAILRDLGKRFGIIVAVYLVAGILLRVLIRRFTTLKLKAEPTPPASRPNRTV
jgi:hypothetical protein